MPVVTRYVPSHSAPGGAVWHRSSHSTGMNNCVEMARIAPELLAVRDSKHATGPTLLLSPAAWAPFLRGVHQENFGPGRNGHPLSAQAAGAVRTITSAATAI